MRCRLHRALLFTLLAASLTVPCFPHRLFAAATPEQIDKALADLGDERFDVRERATQSLFAAGAAAVPALRRAAAGEDPEIRARAEKVLGRFARGVYADTPTDVAELADRYMYADAAERNAILAELSRKGGYGYVVLTKLAEQEQDLWLRGQMLQVLADHSDALPQSASVLLQQEDPGGAERLLATAAATDNDAAIRAYAALLRDQKKLDAATRDLQARLDRGAADAASAAKTLFYFYRAAGDRARAAAVAGKSPDPALAESIALEQQDWPRFADVLQRGMKDHAPELRRLGLLASVQRYAGDQAGFEKTLAAILDVHRVNPGNYWPVATTLLLNDRLQEATDLLVEQKRYISAFDLYAFAGKFDQALGLLSQATADEHADVPALTAMSARVHWRLGENRKALELLDALRAQAGKPLSAFITLVEVQREIGRSDAAVMKEAHENFVKVLRLVEAGSRGDSNEPILERLFEKMYPDRAALAAGAWRLLAPAKTSEVDVEASWDAAVATFDKVMDIRLAPAEWEAIFARVDDPITRSSDPIVRMGRLEHLIDALDAAGQTALADRCFARLHDAFKAAEGGMADLYLYLPKRQVRRQQWRAAIEDCNICAAHLGVTPDLKWLQGWALHQAGEAQKGDEQMRLAARCALGDDQRLAALADMMQDHDHAADSMAVRADMLTVGAPRNFYFYDVFWRRAQAAADQDPAAAAAAWQTYLLIVPDAGGVFTNESAYFEVPRAFHIHHARALYRDGKIAPALDELRALQSRAPLNIEPALICVPELKKLGHGAEARQVFDAVYEPLSAFIAKRPTAAFYHNEIAWLAARCGYELDAALAHAQQAVTLQPNETNSLDTLAEIYFRRGDSARAVELMKRCEALEPAQPRHRERRKEFESKTEKK